MPGNTVLILPVLSIDKEHLTARAQRLRDQGLTHSLKKISGLGKKRKKNETAKAEVIQELLHTSANKVASSESLSQTPSGTVVPQGRIQNAATASLTAKVLAEEEAKAKRRKLGSNDNLSSLFSSGKTKHIDGDFMTRGFSIPAGARH